jgi:hypothetical protein
MGIKPRYKHPSQAVPIVHTIPFPVNRNTITKRHTNDKYKERNETDAIASKHLPSSKLFQRQSNPTHTNTKKHINNQYKEKTNVIVSN